MSLLRGSNLKARGAGTTVYTYKNIHIFIYTYLHDNKILDSLLTFLPEKEGGGGGNLAPP